MKTTTERIPLRELLNRFCDDTGRPTKYILSEMRRPCMLMFGEDCWDRDIRKHFSIENAKRAARRIRAAGYSRTVQLKSRNFYNSMWEWLFVNHMIDQPYNRWAFKIDRMIRRAPIAFTEEQIRLLFHTAETHPAWTDVKRKRVLSMLALTYYTGVRVKHLLQARRDDFNPETGVLRIVNTKSMREQIFRLPPEIVKVVQEGMASYPSHRRYNYVICVRDYQKAFYLVKKYAGLNMMDRMRFHALRKSCATHITSAVGIEAAAKHLGHHDSRTTIERYVDPRQISLETFCQVLDVSILVNSQAPPPDLGDK